MYYPHERKERKLPADIPPAGSLSSVPFYPFLFVVAASVVVISVRESRNGGKHRPGLLSDRSERRRGMGIEAEPIPLSPIGRP